MEAVIYFLHQHTNKRDRRDAENDLINDFNRPVNAFYCKPDGDQEHDYLDVSQCPIFPLICGDTNSTMPFVPKQNIRSKSSDAKKGNIQ
jgi:hypothetical protein